MVRGQRAVAGREGGFTLVEILVAVSVMGVISLALASAFHAGFRGSETTQQRTSESSDAQLASAYLSNDVQSMIAVTSTACSAGTLDPIVSLKLPGDDSVSYLFGTVAGEPKLVRRTCTNGTTTDDETLAHFVSGSKPILTCQPSTDCTDGKRPRVVNITVAERNVANDTTVDATALTYRLSGARRTYNSASGGTSTDEPPPPATEVPPLWAKGTAGSNALYLNGNSELIVNGSMLVDAVDIGSMSAVLNSTNDKVGITATRFFMRPGGTCERCEWEGKNINTRPKPVFVSGAVVDPFAGLPAPTAADVPNDGRYQGPGRYRKKLQLTMKDDASRVFAPGIYILEDGLDVDGAINITGTEVMFYVPGGAFDLGQATAAFTAQTTGAYKGLFLWQPTANTSTVSMAKSLTVPNGSLYAPGSTTGFEVASGADGALLEAIIATNLRMNGGGNVVVGPWVP